MAGEVTASPKSKLSRYSDIVVSVAIIAIIGILIVPVPDWLLDFLLAINLTAAIVIVLVTLAAREPLEFSIFPALLLVTTLFRLALNIAATKLILATGQPGHIIQAFGTVVLGGNFVVGVIAFLILVVVQFVVITNGAGRVAEVAARFTLDAMPGKQMSIDADLNAGMITDQEARTRRHKIEAEADFYGAMDGASKFVRGDAIAAILIIVINIVGGFVMGMINGQSDALTILRTYSLLTVGEGLVSQIPALLISTATGLMVTRAADSNVGDDFVAQMLRRPKPLFMAAGLVLSLFLIPGFPKLPMLVVGGIGIAIASVMRREEKRASVAATPADAGKVPSAGPPPEDPMAFLSVDTLQLQLGSNLVPLAMPSEGGDLASRVGQARKTIATELGIVLPMVRIRDNLQLNLNQYAITIRDQVVASYEVLPNHVLAIDSGALIERIDGLRTTEPAFGGDAIWLPASQRERAELANYLVASPAEVLITHLTEVIKQHAHEMLNRQEVHGLIENVKETNKAVVDELVPALLSVGEVQKVLANLLRERVSIRDLGTVLEALADWAPRTKDTDQLGEYARGALARQICKQYTSDEEVVNVMVLDPALEQSCRESVQTTAAGPTLLLDPTTASGLIAAIKAEAERMSEQGYPPALLCSSTIRLAVKRLTERNIPSLCVLAYNEIVAGVDVRAVASVQTDGQNAVGAIR